MARFTGIATLFCAVTVALLVIGIARGATWALIAFGVMALVAIAALVALVVVARNFRNSFRG